jgi:molybdate transport system substrate-binding protein
MKAKSKPEQTPTEAIQLVADGKADLVFLLSTVLVGKPGIDLAGPFPPEFQHFIVINAAVSSATKEPEAAKALIKFLTSDAGQDVIRSRGLEPINH